MNNKIFLNEKVAKKLLKNKKYGKILSAKIISEVIGADYNEVYNSIKESSEEIAFSSLVVDSTVDSLYYNDQCYFNIEFNFYCGESKKRQIESYAYVLYLSQLHSYHNYHNIKKNIQISIDSFDLFHKNEFIYNVLLMEEKHKILYNNLINFVHINIDWLNKKGYDYVVKSGTKLMKMLYFLVCGDEKKLDIIYEKDEIMKEIFSEAKKIAGLENMNLFLTEEEMKEQDQEYYYGLGKNEGLQEGLKEGIAQKEKDVILNMLKENLPLETIIKCVGLPISEVEKIIKENNID